jgi:hypothetical protein
LSCDKNAKNKCFGSKDFTTVTIQITVICFTTKYSPVRSHQSLVWWNLLPIFSCGREIWLMDDLHGKEVGIGQRRTRRLDTQSQKMNTDKRM